MLIAASDFQAEHPERAHLGNPWPVDNVPAALGRLHVELQGTGEREDNLLAAGMLGIGNEHELRLILAAFGYANGSNAEGRILYGDGEEPGS